MFPALLGGVGRGANRCMVRQDDLDVFRAFECRNQAVGLAWDILRWLTLAASEEIECCNCQEHLANGSTDYSACNHAGI